MKTALYLSLAAALILEACQQPSPISFTEPLPSDSFDVSGFVVGQQVQNLQVIDSSTFCSFNPVEAQLSFFKQKGSRRYEAIRHDDIDTEGWSSFFTDPAGRYYFLSRNNELCIHDSLPSSSKSQHLMIRHQFDYLKDSFMLLSMHQQPILIRHDTLIAHYTHGFLKNYPAYLNEPQALAEWKLGKDTAVFLRTYISKPVALKKQHMPFAKYCMLRNTIYLIYPGVDTIYTFDRSNGKTDRIAIHNADYVLPADWDYRKLWTSDYNSYQTKYNLSSFSYCTILYNALSHHFILFYYAPVPTPADGSLAVGKDQQLKALMLDEQLKQVGYHLFSKPFVQAQSYFFIPGKGIAMPVFKGEDNYETIRFYIYNL